MAIPSLKVASAEDYLDSFEDVKENPNSQKRNTLLNAIINYVYSIRALIEKIKLNYDLKQLQELEESLRKLEKEVDKNNNQSLTPEQLFKLDVLRQQIKEISEAISNLAVKIAQKTEALTNLEQNYQDLQAAQKVIKAEVKAAKAQLHNAYTTYTTHMIGGIQNAFKSKEVLEIFKAEEQDGTIDLGAKTPDELIVPEAYVPNPSEPTPRVVNSRSVLSQAINNIANGPSFAPRAKAKPEKIEEITERVYETIAPTIQPIHTEYIRNVEEFAAILEKIQGRKGQSRDKLSNTTRQIIEMTEEIQSMKKDVSILLIRLDKSKNAFEQINKILPQYANFTPIGTFRG